MDVTTCSHMFPIGCLRPATATATFKLAPNWQLCIAKRIWAAKEQHSTAQHSTAQHSSAQQQEQLAGEQASQKALYRMKTNTPNWQNSCNRFLRAEGALCAGALHAVICTRTTIIGGDTETRSSAAAMPKQADWARSRLCSRDPLPNVPMQCREPTEDKTCAEHIRPKRAYSTR